MIQFIISDVLAMCYKSTAYENFIVFTEVYTDSFFYIFKKEVKIEKIKKIRNVYTDRLRVQHLMVQSARPMTNKNTACRSRLSILHTLFLLPKSNQQSSRMMDVKK